MKYLIDLLEKHIDFHFALAIIAILGTAASLYLQFNEANIGFDILDASVYSVIQSHGSELRESVSINQELDELGKSLDELNLN